MPRTRAGRPPTAPAALRKAPGTGARPGRADTSFDATDQGQVAKGVQLQPDLPHVVDPAGGHLARDGRVTGDGLVFGLRTTIAF